jgi:uncharacterized membrane protein YdjX (TVP38/TMEM64 family)
MEILVYAILTAIGLGVLWAAAAIFMAGVGLLLSVFTAVIAGIVAFFTGRWLFEKLSKDYPEKSQADKT